MNTTRMTPHDLKAGMIVQAHGGRFLVQEDAGCSVGHRPSGPTLDTYGPTDCAFAHAVCIEGEIPGYFNKGSRWTFQGNHNAVVMVENGTF